MAVVFELIFDLTIISNSYLREREKTIRKKGMGRRRKEGVGREHRKLN